ncbi:MAG: single-stranded DNA-binding protein, partial [Bacteroidota bacterium]
MRNKIQLIGYLGQNVDLKEFNSGKTMAKVSVATNDYYKSSEGERQKTTQWHNCVAWGRTAKNMEKIL